MIDFMKALSLVSSAKQAHIVVQREGRHILFFNMTVLDNLKLGTYTQPAQREKKKVLDWIFSLFSIIEKRQHQRVGSLSGREQNMLAIAGGLALLVLWD